MRLLCMLWSVSWCCGARLCIWGHIWWLWCTTGKLIFCVDESLHCEITLCIGLKVCELYDEFGSYVKFYALWGKSTFCGIF